ncbi:MAG: flavin reductase [Clostridiales bacterium]|nr:flavin reductase [Clostridiales bacterium]
MRKDFGSLGAVYPMPVLIVAAYDENGVPCAMNAAWGMICGMHEIALFIDEDHKTTQNIFASKAFTVSLADKDHIVPADYVGIATGNKVPDKFAKSGLTAVKSNFVNAPVIPEFPVCMECELLEVINTEHVYAIIGRIVNTSADEKVIGENGKIEIDKLNALIFDQFQAGYYVTGEKAGQAWRDGRQLMD